MRTVCVGRRDGEREKTPKHVDDNELPPDSSVVRSQTCKHRVSKGVLTAQNTWVIS